MLKIFCLIFSLFIFLPLISQGASLDPSPLVKSEGLDVVINEIAWMGTENSANDEWIELYNNSEKTINLGGWILKTADKTPKINLKGTIPAKGFYLLERTDDETVLDIKADLIYKGSLNNKGEYLKLINLQEKVVDEIDCSSKWFVGDNKTKRTMERINSLFLGNDPKNWQTSHNPEGTPKSKNSPGLTEDRPPQAETASIGEKVGEDGPRTTNSFLIAFAVAVFSAIIILILKKAITPQGSNLRG